MYSNRKKVVVDSLKEKIIKNKSEHKMSWAVWVEESIQYYYEFTENEFKMKVWGESDWKQTGLIENLDWHLLMFFMLNLKASKPESIYESVHWYMYKPQHQVNKAFDKLGSCLMKVLNKGRS